MLFHLSPNPQLLPNTLPHMPNTPHQPQLQTTSQTTYPKPHISNPHLPSPTSPSNFSHVLLPHLPHLSITPFHHLKRPHIRHHNTYPKRTTLFPVLNPIIFHPNNPHPFRRKIPCEKTSKKRGFTPSYYHPRIPSTLT